MTGELKRVSLRYRTCDMRVYGQWYGEDGSYIVATAFICATDGDLADAWPLIEGTDVGEELTSACAQKIIDEEAAAAREASAAVRRE